MSSDQAGEDGSRLPRSKINEGRNITRSERYDCRVQGERLDQQVHLDSHKFSVRLSPLHTRLMKVIGLIRRSSHNPTPSQTHYEAQGFLLDQLKPQNAESGHFNWNMTQSQSESVFNLISWGTCNCTLQEKSSSWPDHVSLPFWKALCALH